MSARDFASTCFRNIVVAILLIGWLTLPSSGQAKHKCFDRTADPEKIVEACSALLEKIKNKGARELARVYSERGRAHSIRKGNLNAGPPLEDAINDYSVALSIEPKNTDYLRMRGDAYLARGIGNRDRTYL